MARFVNGPVNVVRLEGTVFSIRKILFVFFNLNIPCNQETKCGDIFAKNVTRYFIDQFRNSNKEKMYDFFLETLPSKLEISSDETHHDIYIQEMRDLMTKIIKYEKKTNGSKIFPNIRVHYIDVQDHLYEEIFYHQIDYLKSICQQIYIKAINYIDPTLENINFFDNEIKKFYENISVVYNTFFTQQKGGRDDTFENDRKYLIDKIKNNYTHHEIKTEINKILDEQLRKKLESILDKILSLRDLIDRLKAICSIPIDQLNLLNGTYSKLSSIIHINYGPNLIDSKIVLSDIYSIIENIKEYCYIARRVIMDVYFWRRFLDKDYITNGISYTEYDHSLNYIDILVNKFDFKITHASYSKYNIPKLNEKVREVKSDVEFSELFLPLQLQECSNMSSFPEGFD